MLSYRFMPQIVDSQENKALIAEFKIISEEYIKVAEEAINPLSMACCPRRRFNCHCCFTSIFGETKQMGKVLEKTFEGEHRWIKPNKPNKTKIDAMFFTTTGEEVDDNVFDANYKSLPTFILCNPNAMFYQHMINYPHAYYLRYFLQKNINVMIWNYRGYARSKT